MLGFLAAPEFWEYTGESLVFVGVVLEVVCERKLIFKNEDECRERWEGRGSWLLIAGLAISLGALWATNKYFKETIAELSRQSETAKKQAADAAKSAHDAAVDAGAANTLAQSAFRNAGQANSKADLANRKIGGIQEGIVRASGTLAGIEERIAWRGVSAKQKLELNQFLKAYKGASIHLWWESHDPEQDGFAKKLMDALGSAGLNVIPEPSDSMAWPEPENSTLDMFLMGGNANPLLNGLADALVCSSLALPPIRTLPSGEFGITLVIKARNPLPRPPLPPQCKSSVNP
ncbi:MAG TPA: hypothetical protein VMU48_02980 [Terracidiphilus sp.]|nr:hypothetical protein [Terracidiphilus sp.]